jgi:hypothetical protein
MNKMQGNSKGIAVTVAIVTAVGISLVAMLAVLNRRDETVGVKQEIQYDDFAFSVQNFRKTNSLGSGESETIAQGLYYVVALKIANHAKRVDFTFKPRSAILVDDNGREFHLSENGQRALDTTQSNKCTGPIPAGAFCTTEIAFEVPENTRVATLKISEGGPVGDVLDFVFYGTKRIAIETSK